MEIRYVIKDSSLGKVIIGFTDKGVCFLTFGESESELLKELKKSFKNFIIKKENQNSIEIISHILKKIENPFLDIKIPLDIYGTDFQKKVWDELLKVPPGSVVSYSQIAKNIGQPKAVRAVANACGANKIAVIIPCHRVIRSDGSLGGYSSGLWRKRFLLQLENPIKRKI